MHHHMLKLAQYLAEHRHTQHAWGTNDCNTFIVRWVDQLLNSNQIELIAGKYHTGTGAARFAAKFTPAAEWLTSAGYEITSEPPVTGDILLEHSHTHMRGAWLVLLRNAYTLTPGAGLVAAPVDEITQTETWTRYAI